MTMETTCPMCGRRTIDPLPARERLRCVECDALAKAAPKLLQACKAVLHAIESADLDGCVLWILPPYQADAVHESANERLQAVIEEAEGEGDENPWPTDNDARLLNQTISTHTTGPWMGQPEFTVQASNGAWYQTIVGFPPDTCVARAIGSTREECDANARLIAAAPELLDACQAVQQWGLKGKMPDGRFAFDLLAPAIAKATSQTTTQP